MHRERARGPACDPPPERRRRRCARAVGVACLPTRAPCLAVRRRTTIGLVLPYCFPSPDHHLSNSGRRAVRLRVLRAAPAHSFDPNAKRPTWHSAQVGRVVPLPDPLAGRRTLRRTPSQHGSCTLPSRPRLAIARLELPAGLSSRHARTSIVTVDSNRDRAHLLPARAGERAPARGGGAEARPPCAFEWESEPCCHRIECR